MEKDPYYVRVRDPQSVHVMVLQSTKRLLEASATYIHIQKLKEERAQLVALLHEQATRVHELFGHLTEFFPHNDLVDRKKPKRSPKKTVVAIKKQAKKSQDHSADEKLAKINRSLEEIEKKLGDLVL